MILFNIFLFTISYLIYNITRMHISKIAKTMKKNEIVIVAGGTGGHIYPAIRIYQDIEENLQTTPLFLTPKNNKGITINTLKPISNIAFFEPPEVKPNIQFIRKTIPTIYHSTKYIKKAKIIISTGGYVSLFPLLIATIMKKDIFLIEINSIPGKATKFFQKHSKKIFCSFESTTQMLKNAIAIGPIVRKEFVKDYTSLSKDTIFKKLNINPKLTNILVIGGSQGAKHINDTILLIAKKRIIPNINIIWITGNKFYQEYKNEIKKLPNNIIPIPYYEKMWELYKIANIVISRAGASTISEILFLQKKAILIPYPYSSDNHQYHNAIEALKKIQGTIIQDQKLSPEILINAIQQLLQNEKKTIGFPQDGTKLIINYISNTIKGI